MRQPYPEFLDRETKVALAYRDRLRPLDPCGFLDETAVEDIGTPGYFGADGEFARCSAAYRTPMGAKRITKIDVAMIPGNATWRSGPPVMFGETPVRVRDSGDFCSASLSFDDKIVLNFTVATKGDLMERGPKVDLCPEATSIAAASIPHLTERPLRAKSKHANVNTKLAKLDPCAVVDVIGKDHPNPWVNSLPTPWSCQMLLDYGVNSTTRHIDFSYVSDAAITRSPGSEEIASRIAGLPSLEEPGGRGTRWADGCQIHVGTDPHWAPVKGVHNRKTEVISVGVEAGGCDAARATAAEVVRLYQQLPD
ncbi:hypothetical protein DFR68_10484 [Nocardia mexicana]|uniref:Uncharacterized protein n=1 Tax=Nocardia mexicana TaxID=279262 RepID=A0A370H686_9NOCA|nr:hypothetical protein DFR68_10484 [Nocardia mexicana]